MKNIIVWWRTISGKLTTIFAVMFIMVLLVINGAAFFGIRYFVLISTQNSLNNSIELILNRMNRGEELTDELIGELDNKNLYFRILSTNKSIVVQSRSLREIDIPLKQGYNELIMAERAFIYRSVFLINRGNFIGYLQVVLDMTREYQFLNTLSKTLFLTSLLGIIGAIITGYTLTRRMLKPISLLTNTARSISISDLGQRLEIKGPEDELTDLAQTFNSMLDRLEEAFAGQQQFVADASHELRTPISVIQGYINLLHRWGKEKEEIRDEGIEAIKNEIDNMGSLVENLLFLARGDIKSLEIKRVFFRLEELIEEVLRETEMLAEGIKVKCDNNAPVQFAGDRKLIKQMLRAFIDNSIKYTPAGGEITINSFERQDLIELRVLDTGIGIPEQDLPCILERFYRVDKARSVKKGTGLGLAIAKMIIDNHRGELRIESQPGVGTGVYVTLPKEGL